MLRSSDSVFLVVPRFQNDFALLSEWLTGSSKLLKTWSNLANTSDLNKESLYTHLVKLLVSSSICLGHYLNGKRKKTVIHEVFDQKHRKETDGDKMYIDIGETNFSPR